MTDHDACRAACPASTPPTVVFTVVGPIGRDDVAGLCAAVRARLTGVVVGTPVVCDVTAIGAVDTVAIDALARMQLTARRAGHRVELRGASPQLRAILRHAGLCDAVGVPDDDAPA